MKKVLVLIIIMTVALIAVCVARIWAMQNAALRAFIATPKIRIGEEQPPLVESPAGGIGNNSLLDGPIYIEEGHRPCLFARGRRRIQLPNGKGYPADEDGDGISDDLDLCPGTPSSIEVDPNGCPADTDADGVPDVADVCLDPPREIPVDRKGCAADSDQDGIYDHLDACPKTPSGITVDSKGCPVDSDLDGVPDHLDACPETPQGASINEQGCWVITGAHFDPGKWHIKQGLYPVLDEIVEILKGNPSLRVEIQGHTDNTGSEAHNLVLSHRRACAVMEYLMGKGVDSARLFAGGYGSSKPIASNTTTQGRAKNRRVELVPIP